MTKRIIWNFELALSQTGPTPNWLIGKQDPLQWEARYFWPENEIITLHGLDDSYLNLSKYTYKHREDTYFLLDALPLNIKERRGQLFYKPLLATLNNPVLNGVNGFGKKINLHNHPADALLPGLPTTNTAQLLTLLQNAKTINITKEIAIYTFPSNPIAKLELSRLTIKTKNYFSLCLQSNSADLILRIATHLLQNQVSCQYVNFLMRI